MRLENQVVSLELAKKMYWSGFDKESIWWWNGTKWGIGGQIVGLEPMKWILSKRIKGSAIENIPAYTVAELGEMLPYRLRLEDDDYWLWQTKLKHGGTEIRYIKSMGSRIAFDQIQADTEADAKAKMLIWLKESSYL